MTPFNLIHYTNSTSRDAQKSEHFTLVYWGFPLPQTWHDGDETKQVNHWYWSFYGDPKADRVLVIHNTIDYGSERSFDFLSCRDGRTIQIDRRRGEGRRLFLAAKKRIEATHDGHGYHVTARPFIRWIPIGVAESLARSLMRNIGRKRMTDWAKPFLIATLYRTDLAKIELTTEQIEALSDLDMLNIAQRLGIQYLESVFVAHLGTVVNDLFVEKEQQQ